jgi:predicted metal-dependent enzyme (double-stranded beta helix superfamily)
MLSLATEPLLGERLDPAELTAVAEAFARAGDGWRQQVRFDDRKPVQLLLHADERCDVWLRTWLPGQSTDVHHHHGSATAIAVVDGRLEERRWSRLGRFVRRRHRAGRPFWVAPGTVHEIQNRSRYGALSIHAYSPPLLRTSLSDANRGPAVYNTRANELVPVAS